MKASSSCKTQSYRKTKCEDVYVFLVCILIKAKQDEGMAGTLHVVVVEGNYCRT